MGGRLIGCWVAVAVLMAQAVAHGQSNTPIQVVTTTAQIADLARAVGGEHVRVMSLMGEGVDPHTYRQTRSDIVKLRQADFIIYNGLYLEAQLEGLLETLSQHQSVLALGDLFVQSQLLSHPSYAGKFDPMSGWTLPYGPVPLTA